MTSFDEARLKPQRRAPIALLVVGNASFVVGVHLALGLGAALIVVGITTIVIGALAYAGTLKPPRTR